MQDHTFDDIMELVYPKVPLIPKVIVRKIIRYTLRKTIKLLESSEKTSVSLYNSSVSRLYHPIDFKELNNSAMDLDETKESSVKLINPKFLAFLNGKRSPRYRIRSKPNTTIVFHNGAYRDSISKKISI